MKLCRVTLKRRQCLCLLVILGLSYCVFEIFSGILRKSFFRQFYEYELDRLPSLNENEGWIISTSCIKHKPNTTIIRNAVWNIYHINRKKSEDCIEADKNLLQLAVIDILKRGGKYIFLTKRDSIDQIKDILSRLNVNPFTWKLDYDYSETWTQLIVSQSPHVQKYVENVAETKPLDYPGVVSNYGLPMYLPKNDIISLSKYDTLFRYDTFWAIYPLSKNDDACSLWTQMIFQTLNIDLTVMVGSGKKRESPIKMNKLPDEWQSDCVKDRLFCCVLSLSRHMLQINLISQEEFREIVRWVYNLSDNGYRISDDEVTQWSKDIDLEPKYNLLYASPVSRDQLNSSTKCLSCDKDSICPATVEKLTKQSNILLVIVFNREGHYGVVEYLEKLYRPVFKHILYCGTNIQEFQDSVKSLHYPVSFIEMLDNFYVGQQGYQCIQNAIRMNYDVEGYLHLSDDVLFNVWNLADLPTDKFWFQPKARTATLEQETVVDIWRDKSWWPWESMFGRRPLIKAFRTLRNLAESDYTLKTFLNQLAVNSGSDQGVYYEASDIFYVPMGLSKEFSYIISIFNTHGVYLEIAIPTAIYCLDASNNIYKLRGNYLWYTDRNYAQEMFHYDDHFIHPIKLGKCVQDSKCLKFLCKTYLPCLNAVIPDYRNNSFQS